MKFSTFLLAVSTMIISCILVGVIHFGCKPSTNYQSNLHKGYTLGKSQEKNRWLNWYKITLQKEVSLKQNLVSTLKLNMFDSTRDSLLRDHIVLSSKLWDLPDSLKR